jgi:hypothetical protein
MAQNALDDIEADEFDGKVPYVVVSILIPK